MFRKKKFIRENGVEQNPSSDQQTPRAVKFPDNGVREDGHERRKRYESPGGEEDVEKYLAFIDGTFTWQRDCAVCSSKAT